MEQVHAATDDSPVGDFGLPASTQSSPNKNTGDGNRRGSHAVSSPPSPPNASESCRLCVSNLPKFFGMAEIKKFFQNKLSITVKQVKPVKGRERGNLCFVTFNSDDDMKLCQDKISTCMFKGKVLKTERAEQAPNKFRLAVERNAKHRRESQAQSMSSTKAKEAPPLSIVQIVAPLYNIPYDPAQLREKVNEIVIAWKKYSVLFRNKAQESMPWLNEALTHNSGMLCELRPIVKLPWASVADTVLLGGHAALLNSKCLYRNKCEFTFGLDVKGSPEVGFRVAKFRQGNLTVEFPTDVPFVSPSMKIAAHHMRSFLLKDKRSESSQPYNELTKAGHYRQLTVRENRKGQLLVAVYMHPQKLSAEQLDAELEALRQHFTFASESDINHNCCCCNPTVNLHLNIHSLIVVTASGSMPASIVKDSPIDSTRILIGDGYIEEQLLDLSFRISHSSFFQTNAYGAENLYRTILAACSTATDATNKRDYSTMFDLCCGTGTISLLAAKNLLGLKRIIGIEANADAVRDAQCNAEYSGVLNAMQENETKLEFIPALVELALPDIARKMGTADDISDAPPRAVAVLDPPRSGVQASVVDALRKCDAVERIIYAACAPSNEQVMQNIYRLCRCSRNASGESFRPTYAVPVDLFPFTKHCELIIVFDRYHESMETTVVTKADVTVAEKPVVREDVEILNSDKA